LTTSKKIHHRDTEGTELSPFVVMAALVAAIHEALS